MVKSVRLTKEKDRERDRGKRARRISVEGFAESEHVAGFGDPGTKIH